MEQTLDQTVDLSEYQQMFDLDPEGFDELLAYQSTEAVTTFDCPNGERVVQVERRKLHSGRDPRAEAKRFVRGFPLDGKRIVLLMGYASGYVAHALQDKESCQVIVYESSLDILKEGLAHLPPRPEIQIITSHLALERHFQTNHVLAKDLKMLQWPASARIQREAFDQTNTLIIQCLNQSQLTYNTHNTRSQDWLANYLENLPQFSKHPNLNTYRNALAGYPAVICSAGPSLTQNAHLLKKLQGKCVIISVNTAARALASIGVQADIIVSVESLDVTSQFEGISWLPKCTAFLEVTGTPAAFDCPFGATVPISVHSDHAARFSHQLAPGQTFSAGFCVAHAALALATELGCNGIVLIGQNLAFDNGRAYAKGTSFEDLRVSTQNGRSVFENTECKEKIFRASKGTAHKNFNLQNGVAATKLPAWGGSGELVETSAFYSIFAKWFSDASLRLQEQEIWHVNATEGGIHIENWEDLPLADTIDRYQLDQAPSDPQDTVQAKLAALAKKPGLTQEHLKAQLLQEQQKLALILSQVVDLRSWVNDDPDGDITADEASSVKIFGTWEVLREQIRNCHLLQAQIAHSLTEILKRQELNTFVLSTVLEAEIRQLSDAITTVLNRLDAKAPQTRAAS